MDLCSTHAYTPLLVPITEAVEKLSLNFDRLQISLLTIWLQVRLVLSFARSIVVASLIDVLSLLGKMAGTRKTSFGLYSWGARRNVPK